MSVTRLASQLALLSAMAALIGCSLSGCRTGGSSSEAIVEVNGQRITRGEYMEELHRGHSPLSLKKLINRAIVRQLAADKGLKPDKTRVDWKLDQAEARAGSARALEERLAAKNQTIEDLRESLAQEALADQLIAAQVDVADQEIEEYYEVNRDEFKHGEMIKGRLILRESRRDAEVLFAALLQPEADFAGLAKALSMDPGTQAEGGDMGWIERGDYTSEITDAAFKLEPGEFTDVIECPDGWAIVLVEGKKPGGYKPLEEVRDTIESIIRRDREAALRPQWAAEQFKKARVTILDKDLAERFALIQDR